MFDLSELLRNSAERFVHKVAIDDPRHGTATYSALIDAANGIAQVLVTAGLSPGDRVGVYAPKSVGVVAAIFGILRARAAYVPIDPVGPPHRAAFIISDCRAHALVVGRRLLRRLQAEMPEIDLEIMHEIEVVGTQPSDIVVAICRLKQTPAETLALPAGLAYILYTSGSTGVPKGVMHSHESALAFIDWCSTEFCPSPTDTFSSHAPFHFDLSIFDLFVSLKHGATLVLIDEERSKHPLELAALIEERRISIWYSTPTTLRLLVEYGRLQPHHGTSLRILLFAGEVFPPKHQRALRAIWPHPVYYNLYGPTETNVCTYERVDTVPKEEDAQRMSIGRVCSGDSARVVNSAGEDLPAGNEGELVIAGGSVMLGYWNLPGRNAEAFLIDDQGIPWYKTGDIVIDSGGGRHHFLGRRDRMIKRRGYRVELGEIEAALHRHGNITEAAVIAIPDVESGVLVKAFINWLGDNPPSLIELKSFMAKNVPAYMIPDRFSVLPSLPKTSTDKIDHQRLRELY